MNGKSNGNGRSHGTKSEQLTLVQKQLSLELAALEELDKKMLIARDRIRSVVRQETPGFYWHGRSGTGKTHTALAVLQEMEVAFSYHKGHITPQGLLEVMEKQHDKILVLDDVNAIYDRKELRQYLLAALGRLQGQAHEMSYTRQNRQVRFKFTGGIICISNMPCQNSGMLAAFKSRVHTLAHHPTDLMLIALARHRICKNGWRTAGGELSVNEVNEVLDWTWVESQRLNVPLDLRVLFDKALPDYRSWKEKHTVSHWKDLVTTTLDEEANVLTFTSCSALKPPGVRQLTKEHEQDIVRHILQNHLKRKDRIIAWKEKTKAQGTEKSEKAFDRRWAEVKALQKVNTC